MEPLFPLAIVAGIMAAAAAGWYGTRRDPWRSHGLRTSWKIVCYRCSHARPGRDPDCAECASLRMQPLSRYQAEGGGTGFGIAADGPFVGSLCEGEWDPSKDAFRLPSGEWHAPLFDFDFEAVQMPVRWLVGVRKPVPRAAWYRLLDALEAAGLLHAGTAERERTERGKSPELGGIEGYRAQADGALLPDATLCWSVPARLVPSGTPGHWHLYLETKVRWRDYLGIMRLMADAGLLEKEWVDVCERRKMAILRKPGYEKAPT